MRCIHYFLLAAALLPLSAVMADDSSDEAQSIKKIELLGGKLTRNGNLPDSSVIGMDFGENTRVTDGFLHLLNAFTNLTTLDLSGTRLTDAGMHAVGKLNRLKDLDVSKTPITDVGVKELRHLQSLTMLDLFGSQTSEAVLESLVELRNLTQLAIGDFRITDAGLKQLGNLENLTSLVVSSTQHDDFRVKEIQAALPDVRVFRCGSSHDVRGNFNGRGVNRYDRPSGKSQHTDNPLDRECPNSRHHHYV